MFEVSFAYIFASLWLSPLTATKTFFFCLLKHKKQRRGFQAIRTFHWTAERIFPFFKTSPGRHNKSQHNLQNNTTEPPGTLQITKTAIYLSFCITTCPSIQPSLPRFFQTPPGPRHRNQNGTALATSAPKPQNTTAPRPKPHPTPLPPCCVFVVEGKKKFHPSPPRDTRTHLPLGEGKFMSAKKRLAAGKPHNGNVHVGQ